MYTAVYVCPLTVDRDADLYSSAAAPQTQKGPYSPRGAAGGVRALRDNGFTYAASRCTSESET